MRWVIAGASFLAPMLLVIAIGSCVADVPAAPTGVKVGMPPQRMDELYRFVLARSELLERYAAQPGDQASAIPHLALDRFDLRGSDEHGRAWYRLAHPPAPDRDGGVLHRATGDIRPPGRIDGRLPVALTPLSTPWWYWESPRAEAAKSP